jgi:hypothetical protein
MAAPLVFLLPRLLVLPKDAEIYQETPGPKTAMARVCSIARRVFFCAASPAA